MKKIAKLFTMIVLLMICGAGIKEEADAESISSASNYTLGTTQNGMIAENGDTKQYYKFILNSSGSIEVTGTAYMKYITLYIYDESGNEICYSNLEWNSTSEIITIDEKVYLTKGTYYFCIGKRLGYTGTFNFKIDFTTSNETFSEVNGGSNNSIDMASSVSTDGIQYTAQLALNDEKDFYKITLPSSGEINFKATFYKMSRVQWYFYDEMGNQLYSEVPEWNSTTEDITVDDITHFTSGTYYLVVSRHSYGKTCGVYNFTLNFISADESFSETNGGTNNSIGSACSISENTLYKGQLAINDNKDFYKFTLLSAKSIDINIVAEMERLYVTLYDASGNQLWQESPSWNSTTQKISYTRTADLTAGSYYLAVSKYSYGWVSGNYTLSIGKEGKSDSTLGTSSDRDKSLKSLNLKVTAKSGKKYVTVKSVSNATVKITFKKPHKEKYSLYTDASGKCKQKLSFRLKKGYKLQVRVSKSGYKAKTQSYIVR